jgi:hypothetical protein
LGKKKAQPWADLAAVYGLAALDLTGGPPRDYELLIGLQLNTERAETRRDYGLLRAVRDSRAEVTPIEYLLAGSDDPEEAIAIHNLLASRAGCSMDEEY